MQLNDIYSGIRELERALEGKTKETPDYFSDLLQSFGKIEKEEDKSEG
jgi:hypothetical protein